MHWSITRKMVAMGVGIGIALAVLAGISYNSYRVVNKAMDTNMVKNKQLQLTQQMQTNQLQLALAATKSIADRENGKIPDERMEQIKKISADLSNQHENLRRAADTDEKKASAESIVNGQNILFRAIQEDLVKLIENGAARVGAIETQFKNTHEALNNYAGQVDTALGTIGAALQFQINMADNQEKASKYRDRSEQLNYISKAVSRLLLSAIEAIVDKSSGKIDEKIQDEINRNISFLEKSLPKFSASSADEDEKKNLLKVEENLKNLIKMVKEDLPALIQKSAVDTVQIDESFDKFYTELNKNVESVAQLLDQFAKISEQEVEAANGELQKTQVSTFRNGLIVICVALLVITLLFSLFARSITKPVNRIIKSLNLSATQVSTSSTQVSAASQTLAEGASEQAASIEETSSSLEEMSAMTKQNADNANQADALMTEVNQVVGKANSAMTDLTTSMDAISHASEETSKIIKTIDEIAFQTNLLALNAAVEAARAGEAGAGFAVVADEVRNLAMRAATAAKDTAVMIEGTVKKVSEGSESVTRTSEAFSIVASRATKVGELVSEIASASQEQSQGIDQVNKAVAEMDKIVQQNAANAEESASSSQEMTAQANGLSGIVSELIVLVRGGAKRNAGRRDETSPERDEATTVADPKRISKSGKERQAFLSGKEIDPDSIIPMRNEKF